MRSMRFSALGILFALNLAAAATAGVRGIDGCGSCSADLDSDGATGPADLAILLGDWGLCTGCASDFDGDGNVGPADLASLLGQWGACTFDYGPLFENPEAAQLGLELLGPFGPLTLPAETYARIDRDLDLIRAFEPALVSVGHTPDWAPASMIVGIDESADAEQYDCLNAFYSVAGISCFTSIDFCVLTFPAPVNIPALANEYLQAPSVTSASVDGLFGGADVNKWTPTILGDGVWQWHIDDGFGDCFAGCICHILYTFEVDAEGNVMLTNYSTLGGPFCAFPM